MSKSVTCISVRNVSFSYGEEEVLQDISFSLDQGEYAGIIGPNGSGKSTLVKVLTGLLTPQKGEIELFGESIKKFSDRHAIGYVPQRLSQMDLKFPVTVNEVIASGRVTQQKTVRHFQKENSRAVEEAMDVCDIGPLRSRLMGELSGGQRQRVFISRALAGESKLLILDEPSVGIDINSQELFYNFLRHVNDTLGITIILVSHDIDVIAHEVKTLLCLNKTLICHGKPQTVLSEKNFKQMYGRNLKAILHGHEPH